MSRDKDQLRMNELRRELRNLSRNSDSIRDPKLRKKREKIQRQIQEAVDRESRRADRDSAEVSRKGFKEGGEVRTETRVIGGKRRKVTIETDDEGNEIAVFTPTDPMPEKEQPKRVKKRGGGYMDRMMYAGGGEVDRMMYGHGGEADRMKYGHGGEVYNNKKKYSVGGHVTRKGAVEYQDGGNRVIRGGVKG